MQIQVSQLHHRVRGRNKDFIMYGQMAVHNDFCTDIFKFCADIVPLYVYRDTTFSSDPVVAHDSVRR